MWQPWSRLLERLGRIRFLVTRKTPMLVGNPVALDAQGTPEWKRFTDPEALFRTWGPVDGSPWEPFHCVPLFAALDRIPSHRVGPTGAGSRRALLLPKHVRPGVPAPRWLDRATWTILDLPGAITVETAAWLVTSGGCQPVCTFDHWPHPNGVLQPERILADLLHWASTVAQARSRLTPDSPPLWICDSERLGPRIGRPGEFDNRYFLDDSILPGPGLLARAGIQRVVYVSPGSGEAAEEGDSEEAPIRDLEAYFSQLLNAGIQVLHCPLSDPSLEPRPFAAPPSPRPPSTVGFRRSAAGGFGSEVPQPSSSSSG